MNFGLQNSELAKLDSAKPILKARKVYRNDAEERCLRTLLIAELEEQMHQRNALLESVGNPSAIFEWSLRHL